jgi:glyoxylase-like metal-dependent hydrolase (beta-lactamase superfamily II)
VSYFDEREGVVWAGDTAGLRFTPSIVFTLPPTPPPDIDLEAWRESLRKLRAWSPETVFITHFGPYVDAAAHFRHFERSLEDVAQMARRAMQLEAPDEAKYAQFKQDVERYVRAGGVTAEDVRPLEHVGPLEFNWRGLVRYWKKKSA